MTLTCETGEKMRDYCLLCGESLLGTLLFECNNMPKMSQCFPKYKEDKSCIPVKLNFCQCKRCGLLQVENEAVEYYKDSTRAGGRSETFIELRKKDYNRFIGKYNLTGKKIVEIGAGQGEFLETLLEMKEYNMYAYGMEYNKRFVDIANSKEGINVFQGDVELETTVMEGAPYDAFVSFAYFARLKDPGAALRLIEKNLKPKGMGMVLVPSAEHILEPGGIFDLTSDHLAYYSRQTLRLLFEMNNFDVVEQFEEGLYGYIIVKKRERIAIGKYKKEAESILAEVKQYVDDAISDGKKIAIWCSGHFALTIISMSGIAKNIEYIIDNAPSKQDRYSPGSGIRVKSSDYYNQNPVDTIIIMGQLYEKEILKEIREKIGYQVEVISVRMDGVKEF